MDAEEGGDTAVGLKPGLIDVTVHAAETLDLEGDVSVEDIGDGPWPTGIA